MQASVDFCRPAIFGGRCRRVDPYRSAGRRPLRRLSSCPIGDRAWIDDHVPIADPYVRWTHPWHYPSNGEFTVIHIRESSLNKRRRDGYQIAMLCCRAKIISVHAFVVRRCFVRHFISAANTPGALAITLQINR